MVGVQVQRAAFGAEAAAEQHGTAAVQSVQYLQYRLKRVQRPGLVAQVGFGRARLDLQGIQGGRQAVEKVESHTQCKIIEAGISFLVAF